MTRRPRRITAAHVAAGTLVLALLAAVGYGWADDTVPGARGRDHARSTVPGQARDASRPAAAPGRSATGVGTPAAPGPSLPSASAAARPGAAGPPSAARGGRSTVGTTGPCRTGVKLVPTCGILWGVAPGAFTDDRGAEALHDFERKTGRHQDIYHAYHRGANQLFPTAAEMRIAREPGHHRILFLNWKPAGTSWAKIAKGDRRIDGFLDRLARHLRHNFREPFFFTVFHEAEDNVRERPGSGYTAEDYARMYPHVINRLRAHGADNLVTVLVNMAYVPHTSQSWFERMYPGNDVVDWIGFDTYAYSDPGYGHGDFAELLNRRSAARPSWPGFYNWAGARHPDKPLMVAEWGVWSSRRNPGHKAQFYREVGRQIYQFPRVKAMVHFDTPHNQDGRDSSVDASTESLRAYRKLGRLPVFQVQVSTGSR